MSESRVQKTVLLGQTWGENGSRVIGYNLYEFIHFSYIKGE